VGQLRSELQIPDEKEALDIKRLEAQVREQKELDTMPHMMTHYNDVGHPTGKHRDYNHQQQPGGRMRGK
jgi:hypothetical protein